MQDDRDQEGEDANGDDGLAAEEDVVILDALEAAVLAARRKGYDEELLVRVLRGLFSGT